VSETATKYLEQGGIHDIKSGLQDLVIILSLRV